MIQSQIEIVDRWSTRILPLPPQKSNYLCDIDLWPGTGTRHIGPSWVVLVSQMNIIHDIGNKQRAETDGQADGRGETDIPQATSLCAGYKCMLMFLKSKIIKKKYIKRWFCDVHRMMLNTKIFCIALALRSVLSVLKWIFRWFDYGH